MGCLLAPFRALGCLVIVAGVAAAWLYRDRVLEAVLELAGRRVTAPAATGRPGTRALATARARADSVRRGAADSVVLSPAEAASLIGDGLDPIVRRQLDSLEVRLLDGEIEVGARVAVARLPAEVLGPFGRALHDRERIKAAGPVTVVSPGRAEWQIERLDLAGFPLPADAVAPLLGRALGGPRRALPVVVPPGVRDIRIRPTGAVLFGARSP
jgi:hypothetical protein